MKQEIFDRYARWIDRRRRPVLIASGVVAALSTVLALGLPLRADLSRLLPPNERSVRDLDRIEGRTPVLGLVLCAVASDDPALRARSARVLATRIRGIDPALVAAVTSDDGDARRFAWQHRFLFAPLEDLRAAKEALQARIGRAKLDALYVSLDDDQTDRLRELAAKLRLAEDKALRPDELVSKDGQVQLVIVQTAFASTDVTEGERLVAALDKAMAQTAREVGPAVAFGNTEDVVIAIAEHRAILGGMSLAVVLTVIVVGVSLMLFYRSVALLALLASLAVGTVVTFGLTRLTIGHLNSLTAFLSSIVVGNGINFGIIVLARHLEERRHGQRGVPALARALGGAFTGTLTAALAAGVAYASLVVTDFRGFRDFGFIGGVGMVLCWLSSYTVLPALLAVLERRGLVQPGPGSAVGPLLARLVPRRPARVVVAGAALFVVSAFATSRYLGADPFEYDWQRMRSDSGLARQARAWMDRIDRSFGRQLVGGFVVGVERDQDAAPVERMLRAHAEDEPGGDPRTALFRSVGSIQDFVPRDQPRKLAVLAQIRRLLDDPTLAAADDEALGDLRRLRPPDDLRALGVADVPEPLARRYVDRDGSRRRLMFANQASRFDGWNGRHMIAFADSVRALDPPPGTVMGGGSFVFADVLRAVTRAGPRATLAAVVGVTLFVILVVGWRRQAAVTLLCVAVGTTTMIAGAALLGLKVNFLDFVALPITLGISVDYSVNVVTGVDGPGALRRALATTGSAVVLCSWTTTVGYASLLLSANAGIRSFGFTAILGEVTCLLTALALAPALLAVLARRPPQDLGARR